MNRPVVEHHLSRLLNIDERAFGILQEKHKEMHQLLADLKAFVAVEGKETHNKLVAINNECLNGFPSVMPV